MTEFYFDFRVFKRCFIASTPFQQNILDSLKLQTLADLLLKMQNLIEQVLELKVQHIHSLLRLKEMVQFRHNKEQKTDSKAVHETREEETIISENRNNCDCEYCSVVQMSSHNVQFIINILVCL